jgi:hypothetical protein
LDTTDSIDLGQDGTNTGAPVGRPGIRMMKRLEAKVEANRKMETSQEMKSQVDAY